MLDLKFGVGFINIVVLELEILNLFFSYMCIP